MLPAHAAQVDGDPAAGGFLRNSLKTDSLTDSQASSAGSFTLPGPQACARST